jgi:tetratricopeptide (TPR) repeat protein
VRKQISVCATIAVLTISTLTISTRGAQAQRLPPPYHPPGAEDQPRRESSGNRGQTYGPPGPTYSGPTYYGGGPGISYPGYWTYNRFSNLGFGGLNWYYGPLGGYTPYIGTPYATTNYGYPYFGPYYSYVPLAPVVRQRRYGYDAQARLYDADDGAVQQGNGGQGTTNGKQPGAARQPPPPQRPQPNVKIFAKPTSPDALRRSIRYQAQGDEYFAKQNYLQAYGHYKQAVSATPGRTEPRFRLALALAATTNYSQAVDEIKKAMRMNPNGPRDGASLDELFGADNIIAKNAVLHKVAGWVREDIRDSDRLFLMGVLLHFNDDTDKSYTFFEAAFDLSPNTAYAQAFLDAENDERARRPAEEPRPAPPEGDQVEPAALPQGPQLPLDLPLDLKVPARPAPAGRKTPAPLPARKVPEEPRPRPLAGIWQSRIAPFGVFGLDRAGVGA